MTPDGKTALTDILQAHAYTATPSGTDPRLLRCLCGEYVPSWAAHVVEVITEARLQIVELPEPEGLFASPVPEVRFCGLAMGGYGSYDELSTDEAVVELIVPADMVSGRSIKDFNSSEGRHRFAAALLSAAVVVGQPTEQPATKHAVTSENTQEPG